MSLKRTPKDPLVSKSSIYSFQKIYVNLIKHFFGLFLSSLALTYSVNISNYVLKHIIKYLFEDKPVVNTIYVKLTFPSVKSPTWGRLGL